MPSVKNGTFFSLTSVDICASGSFWISTLTPIFSSDSRISAAIGSAVAACPTLKLKVVEKPSGSPASARSVFALARSRLTGCATGKVGAGRPRPRWRANSGLPRPNRAA